MRPGLPECSRRHSGVALRSRAPKSSDDERGASDDEQAGCERKEDRVDPLEDMRGLRTGIAFLRVVERIPQARDDPTAATGARATRGRLLARIAATASAATIETV